MEQSKGKFIIGCKKCGSWNVNLTICGLFSKHSLILECVDCTEKEVY